MKIPEWFRCRACGRSDTALYANPPCPNRNNRRFSNGVQTVCAGCHLWCYDHWSLSSAQAVHTDPAEPVAQEVLGL